jgi:uncharacterized membrane protein YqjE
MKAGQSSLKEKLEKLGDQVGNLAETGYKIAMLEVSEKIAQVASATIIILVSLFFVIFLFLFVGIGLSLWIGEALMNPKAGFFIVGGIYLLLIVGLFALRKSVISPLFKNIITKKLYE